MSGLNYIYPNNLPVMYINHFPVIHNKLSSALTTIAYIVNNMDPEQSDQG